HHAARSSFFLCRLCYLPGNAVFLCRQITIDDLHSREPPSDSIAFLLLRLELKLNHAGTASVQSSRFHVQCSSHWFNLNRYQGWIRLPSGKKCSRSGAAIRSIVSPTLNVISLPTLATRS